MLKNLKGISRYLAVLAVFTISLVGIISGNMGPAWADGLSVDVDTSSVLGIAGTVLVALGAIWPIRKCVKLVNRS